MADDEEEDADNDDSDSANFVLERVTGPLLRESEPFSSNGVKEGMREWGEG